MGLVLSNTGLSPQCGDMEVTGIPNRDSGNKEGEIHGHVDGISTARPVSTSSKAATCI